MASENRKDKQENKKFGAGVSRRQVITVVALVAMVWGAWYFTRMAAGFDGESAAWVHIPRNASRQQAEDSIVSALGSDFGARVAMLWNGNPEASRGAYRIEPGEKAWKVARRIGRGQQTPVKVTFNNLRTFRQIAGRLSEQLDFTAEDFEKTAKEECAADSIDRMQFEAQFLPDTYEAYWSATPKEIMDKMRRHYARFWNAERKAKADALGLTPLQVSVLASIAEEETNRRDERGKIARLYINRLKRGMPLQADPTVKFATGDFAARRITADMLKTDSPYNTYRVAGLPPGIIRLPEAATIDAVLNAPEHGYIYMCARPDGSGYHDFTSDYSTHLRNAKAYRATAYSRAGK